MDEGLTMGEQVVLLALDEERGVLREAPLRVGLAVSAAALLGLAFSGHVVVRDGVLVAVSVPPPEDPAAVAMAERMRNHPDETPRQWLLAVRDEALTAAYDGLLAKHLVREEGRRVLGAFGSIRYPVTDPAVPAALRRRLAAVLLEGRKCDEETATLITMLHHAGLRAVMLPDADADADADGSTVEARLAALDAERGPAATLGEAVRTAVAAITAITAVSGL